MSILTALAGNYLGSIAQRASGSLLDTAREAMSKVGFERILNNIETQKLTLNDLQLSDEEKAEILDLINIAKQGEMSDFEIEIHGHLYSLDTSSLELSPAI
jgi:hypothetical protein